MLKIKVNTLPRGVVINIEGMIGWMCRFTDISFRDNKYYVTRGHYEYEG